MTPPPETGTAVPPAGVALRLVMLDIDGTLVDSQHGIVAAMDAACRSAGVVPPSADRTRAIIGLSLPEAIASLLPDLDAPAVDHVVSLYRDAFLSMRGRPDFDEPLFPGVRDALDRLDAAGCLLGLATGKSRRGVLAMIERHGLEGRFVTLQTPDDGPGKPDPSMLLRALADTGAEAADTVMVGDTTFDMRMARAAGTDALGVAWGYHPAEALTAAGARLVLPTAAALPDSLAWVAA